MISVSINGRDYVVQAPDDMPLLWVLRDLLNLKGTKFGCGIAQCGACTVHVDGRPVRSCMLPAANVGSREGTTIEAIRSEPQGPQVRMRNSAMRRLYRTRRRPTGSVLHVAGGERRLARGDDDRGHPI